jgi:prepilin-type N-terminal cleavage/methylation domain-containing protein
MLQRRPRDERSGFTLVEVLVAVFVLVCALTAFTRSLLGTVKLGRSNREAALATEGARAVIESFYAVEFGEVFARFNDTAADDPVPGAPGADFNVVGLDAQDGDFDGHVGRIAFPTVGVGAAIELREDVFVPELGMPRDLDGDGAIDGTDHAADYRFLPVEVRVAWRGRTGDQRIVLRTLVAAR